jgi:hypothetical protein
VSKYAICNNCGFKDDWVPGDSGVPVLDGGVIIQFLDDSGFGEVERTVELCPECREELIKHFPNLLKEVEEEQEPPPTRRKKK